MSIYLSLSHWSSMNYVLNLSTLVAFHSHSCLWSITAVDNSWWHSCRLVTTVRNASSILHCIITHILQWPRSLVALAFNRISVSVYRLELHGWNLSHSPLTLHWSLFCFRAFTDQLVRSASSPPCLDPSEPSELSWQSIYSGASLTVESTVFFTFLPETLVRLRRLCKSKTTLLCCLCHQFFTLSPRLGSKSDKRKTAYPHC